VITPAQINQSQVALTSEQQHYLTRVLRLRSGDRFIAMDGQAHSWLAELATVEARLLNPITVTSELPLAVTLALALPKGNGFDEVVRQVTELGVDRIVPIISDRTLLKPSPHKLERWRRIAQEAAEQSERQIVPAILDPMDWQDCLAIARPDPLRLLCVARGNPPHLLECLSQAGLSESDVWPPVTIAIGPEGGWTEPEVERAIAAGYQPVSLGRRILRAVTAPMVALALVAGLVRR
jgi:16S rRNA (uracil1498-N3)-methyltransferase